MDKSAPVLGFLFAKMLRLFALVPLSVCRAFGSLIGTAYYVLHTRYRQYSMCNVKACLPHLSPAEHRRLVRLSLRQTFQTYTEMGAIHGWSPPRLRALTREVVNEELLHQAMAQGKGLVLLVPHLGNWEYLNYFLGQHYRIVAMYRAPHVAEMDPVVRNVRERTGATLVPGTVGGVKRLYRSLLDGKLVAVLPDQVPLAPAGTFAPFFGVPAYTITLVGRLLRRTGASVLCAQVERLPRSGFRIHFSEAPPDMDHESPEVAAGQLNRAVETCVLRTPEQYLWHYRRFKKRPPGETLFYPRRFRDRNTPLPAHLRAPEA